VLFLPAGFEGDCLRDIRVKDIQGGIYVEHKGTTPGWR
jgi:hypothetical protein